MSDLSKPTKKPSRGGSRSTTPTVAEARDGNSSEDSRRSRSHSGGRIRSNPESRSASKNSGKRLSNQNQADSDDDFVSEGARSVRRSKRKAASLNSTQKVEPGQMAQPSGSSNSALENSVENPVENSVRTESLNSTVSTEIRTNSFAENSVLEENQAKGLVPEQARLGNSLNVHISCPGLVGAENDSHGVDLNKTFPTSKKESYLDRKDGRPTPYSKVKPGNSSKSTPATEEDKLLDSYSQFFEQSGSKRTSTPNKELEEPAGNSHGVANQESATEIKPEERADKITGFGGVTIQPGSPGGSDASDTKGDSDGVVEVSVAFEASGSETGGQSPSGDSKEVTSPTAQVNSQNSQNFENPLVNQTMYEEDKIDPSLLKPTDPLIYAGILTQHRNNSISDLEHFQGDGKVDAKETPDAKGEDLTPGYESGKEDREDLLDYEDGYEEDEEEEEEDEDINFKRQKKSGAKTALPPEQSPEKSLPQPTPPATTPADAQGGGQNQSSSDLGNKEYKIPKIPKSGNAKGVANTQTSNQGGASAKGGAQGNANSKKPPSQKKIHRKQKPELVPDFLVIDPAIIPKERDPRYLDNGYDYQSKEVWQADYVFLKGKLKTARLQVGLNVFGTDDIATPTPFLRRFWAATGVKKSRPMSEIVADILNSRNGWTELYNNWTKMDEDSNTWGDTLVLLQEMAIQICRTAAFKKEQLDKNEADAKARKSIEKKAKEQGVQFGPGVWKGEGQPPKNSLKSGRFDKPAKKMEKNTAGSSGAGAPTPSTSSGTGAQGNSSKPKPKKPTSTPVLSTTATNQQDQDPPAPLPTVAPGKPSLKEPAGYYTQKGHKAVTFPPDLSKPPPKASASNPSTSTMAQDRIDDLRQKREEAEAAIAANRLAQDKIDEKRKRESGTSETPTVGVKARTKPGGKVSPDYFLLDLCQKQEAALKGLQTRPTGPNLDATPPQPVTPTEEGEDIGGAGAAGYTSNEEVITQASAADMDFDSASGVVDSNNPNPNSPNSSPKQDGASAESSPRRRIIVESIAGPGGKLLGADLQHQDLTQFRMRLEKHIEDYNGQLEDDSDEEAINIMAPWIERGKIILVPSSVEVGRQLIEIVNDRLKLTGHRIRANWNVALPLTATISIRYESFSGTDPRTLIEDAKKGIAKLNRWTKLTEREIMFQSASSDPQKQHVKFATVIVSKRICGLIQKQRGRLWISGGQATAQWRGKDLTEDLDVQFTYQ